MPLWLTPELLQSVGSCDHFTTLCNYLCNLRVVLQVHR